MSKFTSKLYSAPTDQFGKEIQVNVLVIFEFKIRKFMDLFF